MSLAVVTLVDELWSGVAVVGAPSVEHELGLSHRAYVLDCFVGPLLVAAALEAGIALASDAWSRARLVVAGQVGLAISLAFAAWTRSPWGLMAALALAGTTSGVACSAAQALLVVSDPRGPEAAMTRWSRFGAVGDLLAPAVTAAAMALGATYRGAMGAVAAMVAIQGLAMALATQRAPPVGPLEGAAQDDEPPADPIREALRRALRLPRLWAWLAAAALCTLLDELVVALAALRLERDQGLGDALAAVVTVAFCAGSLTGVALTERTLGKHPPRRVLLASSALCAVALALLVASRSPLASCGALFLVGLTCAPHHPLALARAYGQLPLNPGTVQAIGQLFVIVDIGAPLALGWAADRFGLGAALSLLLLQPAAIALCALLIREPDP